MAYSICVLLFWNDRHSVEAAMNDTAYSTTSAIEDAGCGKLILIWRFTFHMESNILCELNIQQLINGAEIRWYTIILKCDILFW